MAITNVNTREGTSTDQEKETEATIEIEEGPGDLPLDILSNDFHVVAEQWTDASFRQAYWASHSGKASFWPSPLLVRE